ncbi:hypothetical protein RUND412_001048 [Rhizina undulata]
MASGYFSKQDARYGPPMLDLETYDKNAMLEDLGAHRKAALPLSGRMNFRPPPPPDIYKRGEALARKAIENDEVVSKWGALYDPSLEEDRDDGLGGGHSHRTGPNYRPSPVGGFNRRKSPPRRHSLSPRRIALGVAGRNAPRLRQGIPPEFQSQRMIRPRRTAPPGNNTENSPVLKSVSDNPPSAASTSAFHAPMPAFNSPMPPFQSPMPAFHPPGPGGAAKGITSGYPTYAHSHAGFGSYTPDIPLFSDYSPAVIPSPATNRPKRMENPNQNPDVAHWHSGMLMTNARVQPKTAPVKAAPAKTTPAKVAIEDVQQSIINAIEKQGNPTPANKPKAVSTWTGYKPPPSTDPTSQKESIKQPIYVTQEDNSCPGDKSTLGGGSEPQGLDETPASTLNDEQVKNPWTGDKPVSKNASRVPTNGGKVFIPPSNAESSRDGSAKVSSSLEIDTLQAEGSVMVEHSSPTRVSIIQQEAENELFGSDDQQEEVVLSGRRASPPIVVKLDANQPELGSSEEICTDYKQIPTEPDSPCCEDQHKSGDLTIDITTKNHCTDETQQEDVVTEDNLSEIDKIGDGDETYIDYTEADKINKPEGINKPEEINKPEANVEGLSAAKLVDSGRDRQGGVPVARPDALGQSVEGTAVVAPSTDYHTTQLTTDKPQDTEPQTIPLDTNDRSRKPSPSPIRTSDIYLPFQEEIESLQLKIDHHRTMIVSDKKLVDESLAIEEQICKRLKENQAKRNALNQKIKECEEYLIGLEEEMAVFQSKRTLAIREKEALEDERIALAERLEQERIEMEHLEQERLERERIERERLEKERVKQERLEKERVKQERLEKAHLEKERLEKERLEKERLEKQRLEKAHLEKERIEKELLERERLEKERFAKERLEQGRLVQQQRLDIERRQREFAEKERLHKERLEKQRIERHARELERLEMESIADKRIQKARLQKERLEHEIENFETTEKEEHDEEEEPTEKELYDRDQFVCYLERKEHEKRERHQLQRHRIEQERLEKETMARESLERQDAEREHYETQRKAADDEHREAVAAQQRARRREEALEKIANWDFTHGYEPAPSIISRSDGAPPFPYRVKLDFRPIYTFKPINIWIEEEEKPFDAVENALKDLLDDGQIDTLCDNELFQGFVAGLNRRHSRRIIKSNTQALDSDHAEAQ